TEIAVSMTTDGVQVAAALGMDAAGNFVVVSLNPAGIFARRFDASGAPQGSFFQVSAVSTRTFKRPAVAMTATGNIVVVWEEIDANNVMEVLGRHFDSSGAPIGSQFQINSPLPLPGVFGSQFRPAVRMGQGGKFVVAWDGNSDADGGGIFARILTAPTA